MAQVLNNPIIVGGAGGGPAPIEPDRGIIWNGKYRFRYYDADGTLLKIQYASSFNELVPPADPNYDPDYLIFAGWNYMNKLKEKFLPCDLGAMYNTVDNATYLFCKITDKFVNTQIKLYIQNYTYID